MPTRSRLGWSWLGLGALVLGSTLARAWASRGVPTPWIAPDEMVYGLLGQGLYRDGQLSILGGPTPFYSALVPAITGIPLSVGDLALGYSALKVLQALVMSLAAVPVYLWGRSFMGRRWSFLAAVLSVALPGLAYSGLVMTEAFFYPVFVLAAWAIAAAVESPTLGRQALLVLLVCLATATRLQAVILVPVFLSALVLDAVFARTRLRIARLAPALAGLGLLAAAWVAWRVAAGTSLLGGYSHAGGSYPAGAAARFVAYHAGDAALLVGVFPACALLVLLWGALRLGEAQSTARAYLAVSASLVVWLVLEVGVFASRELGLLAERNLIVAAPVLFLAFALWLDRGGPGGYGVRAIAGVVVAAGVLVLPFGTLVVPEALPNAFTLIPLLHLRLLTSLHATEVIVSLGVGAAVALFALVPRRALLVLPALLFVALAAGSVSAGREVRTQARAEQLRVLGPERRWVDAAADGPVAYVYDGQAWWNAVWENAFWNRRIRWVYDLPGTEVPGPLPQRTLEVRRDGELRPGGGRSSARFAVVPVSYKLRGERVADAPQVGTDRDGLALWKLEPPLRLSTISAGLLPNGDVAGTATLTAYGCRSGTFDLVLLVKAPQTVRMFLDGRPARTARFDAPATWHVRVPVPRSAAGEDRICKLKVHSNGLLGTTRVDFER